MNVATSFLYLLSGELTISMMARICEHELMETTMEGMEVAARLSRRPSANRMIFFLLANVT
jgi:hypothetical protein